MNVDRGQVLSRARTKQFTVPMPTTLSGFVSGSLALTRAYEVICAKAKKYHPSSKSSCDTVRTVSMSGIQGFHPPFPRGPSTTQLCNHTDVCFPILVLSIVRSKTSSQYAVSG